MKTVLLVEDDEVLSRMYRRELSGGGYEVMAAGTGKEALELIHKKNPDIILLDIMLPGGMNGFDVLEELKESSGKYSMPVVMLTNLDSEEETAEDIGVEKYLIKSQLKPGDLVRIVREVLS